MLALLNAGRLALFSGSRPPDPDTPARQQQQLLVELRFGQPAFAPLAAGLAEATPLTPATASASGEASWFRCWSADGNTVVLDGSVGTEDADLVLNSTTIVAGATVSIGGFTYLQAG